MHRRRCACALRGHLDIGSVRPKRERDRARHTCRCGVGAELQLHHQLKELLAAQRVDERRSELHRRVAWLRAVIPPVTCKPGRAQGNAWRSESVHSVHTISDCVSPDSSEAFARQGHEIAWLCLYSAVSYSQPLDRTVSSLPISLLTSVDQS